MKLFFYILAAVVVAGLAFFYFTKDGKDIEKLVSHFKNSGFSVRDVYLSQKEKEGVEEFKNLLEDLGAKNTTIVDSQLKYVNNIEVKITHYKNAEVAEEDYERQVSSKARTKARAEKSGDEYYHTDYFLNDNFILTVHHFDTALDFKKTRLNISKTELDKVVTAFKSF